MYKFILKLTLSESHNNNNNNNKIDKTHKSTQCPMVVSAYALDGATKAQPIIRCTFTPRN